MAEKVNDAKRRFKLEPQVIKDGKYFSPDGGNFTARDNVLYWEDGGITELNKIEGVCVRCVPVGGYDFNSLLAERTA